METSIPYAKQTITDADLEAVQASLKEGWITRGPKVEAFEKALADYVGARYAVAFNSGTSALQATTFAGRVSPHDRVITTPNSFVATLLGALQVGATPTFVDVDPSTGNMSVEQAHVNLAHASSRGHNHLYPVHFAGVPVDMEHLEAGIQDPDTLVVEDAAHALGSCYKDGSRVGNCKWSHMTVFSFHPAKTMTTGEGGLVTTNDKELYERLQLFRNNGMVRDPDQLTMLPGPWYYEVTDATGNYNFTDFQAALGLSQLQRLDQFVERRRHLIGHYRSLLKDVPHVEMSPETYDAQTAYHLCCVRIDFEKLRVSRSELMDALKAEGIGTQVHYIPLYKHPLMIKRFGEVDEYFPQMELFYSQALSLPLFFDLKDEDVERICKALSELMLPKAKKRRGRKKTTA